MRIGTLTCAALLAASTVYAQNEASRRVATEAAARVPLEQAMKGAPYSAELLIEATQQLADGNRIVRKTTGRVYRDGEGRVRREEERPNGRTTISISDPVAGFSYSLDAENKIAWRTPAGAAGAIMGKVEASQVDAARRQETERRIAEVAARGGGGGGTEGARGRGGATVAPAEAPGGSGGTFIRRGNVEVVTGPSTRMVMPTMSPLPVGPLEHKTLEGVPVEGRKSTTTIPAGQVGNEQPLTIVSEQWRSPDLNILVMTRYSDPRTGDSSYRLQNIVRAEPDRSLFMVPADYTVKDSGIRKMLEPSRKQ